MIELEEIVHLSDLHFFVGWTLVAYAVVLVSMLIDFVSAFFRCRKVGEKWVSEKQKRTADKAVKYFLPMIALTFVDCIVLCITKYPIFTLVLAAVNSLTEWVSIFEKTHTKEEQRKAERTMNVILENKDDIANIIKELLKEERTK